MSSSSGLRHPRKALSNRPALRRPAKMAAATSANFQPKLNSETRIYTLSAKWTGRMGRVSGDQEATSSKAGDRPSIDAKYGKPGRIEKSSLRAPEGERLLFKPSSPTFAE